MDECIEDADPGEFGIQTAVEWAVRSVLIDQMRGALGFVDEQDGFDDGWSSALDELLGRVRPNFVAQVGSMAEAVAEWVAYNRPEWLGMDEPFEQFPRQALDYLVGILVLGLAPTYTVRMLDSDRLFAHKVAGGL